MSYGVINQDLLTDIADAIRDKLSVETTYTPAEMPDAIASISGGGITPTGTKSITANGTYDVTNYASAEVAVPTGSSPDLGAKSITANGTYTASDDSLDGYSAVTVAVPASAVDSGTKSISITENGTTTEDVTGYASASITVNVSGGGSSGDYSWLPASAELVASVDETINLSSDTSWDSITPSTSEQTILAAGSTRGACSYTLTAEETANKAIIAVVHVNAEYAYTSSPGTNYALSQDFMLVGNYCMLDLPNDSGHGLVITGNTVTQAYVDSSGNTKVSAGNYYGIIAKIMTFSTSSATSTTPTVGFTRPAIVARCQNTYFSTSAAALIDSANMNMHFKYRIYLVDKADSPLYACFDATNGIIK